MSRTLPLMLAVALVAGCSPSDDQIAEAVAQALSTTSTQAGDVGDDPSVSRCRQLWNESLDLAETTEDALDEIGQIREEIDDLTYSELSRRAERATWAAYRSMKEELNHDSRMVARCSDVEHAGLREAMSEVGDGLHSRASSLRDVLLACYDGLDEVMECPPVPSIGELLPEAQ